MISTDPPQKTTDDRTAEHKPLKSPLGYLGGKSRLARRIVEKIPPHICYVEPFSGGAWVYFTKPPSKVAKESGIRIIDGARPALVA